MNERKQIIEHHPADELSGASASHLQRIRERFVENMWRGIFAVMLVGTPISVLRAVNTGWQIAYTVHLVIALGSLIVFVFMKRLSLELKSAFLLALLWALGLPGLFTMGFPATSVWWLVLSCLVAGTVYPIRVGIVLGGATVLVVAIAALGFITGRLTLAFDPVVYLRQPLSWVALLALTGAFTFIVLRSTWLYNRSLIDLLHQVSEQRDQIELLAAYDQLTGLPLAQRADDRIGLTFDAARRSGRMVALMFIDLDDFKAVNDTFGHEAGDVVLREVSHRIEATIRATDTVTRIGGDELLAVIGELKEKTAATLVASKIIRTVSNPVEFNGQSITVGASVGIAIYPDDGSDLVTLRALADAAMYAAKKSGRNHYAFAHAPAAQAAGNDRDEVARQE